MRMRGMPTFAAGMEKLGPIDLLYSGADHVLNLTQGSIHLDKVSDFIETVRWGEPFIQALLAFQVVLFLLTYLTRRRDFIQFGILLIVTVIALCAETLNEYGKTHWPKFATQDYFDRNGLFMLTFVSGPFVLLANFIVIGMATRLVKLYAKKKRRTVLHQQTVNESTRRESKKES